MSNFLHVLTEKGLAFLMREHKHDLGIQAQIREELHRRGLKIDPRTYNPERELDGYERDWL